MIIIVEMLFGDMQLVFECLCYAGISQGICNQIDDILLTHFK